MSSAVGNLALRSSGFTVADRILLLLRTAAAGNPRRLREIQAQIVVNPPLRADDALIQFVSSCARHLGSHHAALFLRHLPISLDVSLWNLGIRSSTESDSGTQFMVIYKAMLGDDGVPLVKSTLSLVLRGLTHSSADKLGESIHCQILKLGYGSDMFLGTGLLDFYAKIGRLPSAKQMFDEMPDRDVVTNNSMIATLSNHGFVDEARRLFDEMPVKSSATWNSMITGYCKSNRVGAARALFDRNPMKDVISWNAMIDGYCKVGQLEPAAQLFDEMGFGKNSVTWNTMITGYVHHRQFSAAVLLFRQMQTAGVWPTGVTMVCLLSACAHIGALDMGKWIHCYVQNQGLTIDVVLGNALIDMYCKCGAIDVALQVFRQMPVKNIFCWNSIITGLGMHGHGELAVEAFLEMHRRAGFRPDGVTFVGLLSGLSHSGMVSEGRRFFSQMAEVYGVEPEIEHYGCMVDLLGRAGHLHEALKLIGTMPIEPNAVVWGSLLRACRIHRNAAMSEQVARRLVALDPGDGGNYVLLSNIYASARRWEDVLGCRRAMAEKGVRKLPGSSIVEVNNAVHEFVVGDASHPEYPLIAAFLEELAGDLRALGYSPDVEAVLHDVEEEEKEGAVRFHSEKVAVAFAILKTAAGAQVRVVKNLRVCGDCHEFFKLAAVLLGREILLRDRSRFHRFAGGACSCKDFW
ncbi:unnamed protein product [Spirodela intermedia]|uniref:DYW domain-containing protein n=1 Tax=Spirodela intermedia TaxID=51605 RepID=A0A7I8KRG9_SPIIN|nr:unnamed protein product [Spirodela intermedia]